MLLRMGLVLVLPWPSFDTQLQLALAPIRVSASRSPISLSMWRRRGGGAGWSNVRTRVMASIGSGGRMKGEEEDDVWGPHISEVWRELVEGLFSPYENTVSCTWAKQH